MENVLRGLTELSDEDASIQSALRLYIHDGAEEILAIPTKEGRIAALARLPDKIRPHVEARAIELYRSRKK